MQIFCSENFEEAVPAELIIGLRPFDNHQPPEHLHKVTSFPYNRENGRITEDEFMSGGLNFQVQITKPGDYCIRIKLDPNDLLVFGITIKIASTNKKIDGRTVIIDPDSSLKNGLELKFIQQNGQFSIWRADCQPEKGF